MTDLDVKKVLIVKPLNKWQVNWVRLRNKIIPNVITHPYFKYVKHTPVPEDSWVFPYCIKISENELGKVFMGMLKEIYPSVIDKFDIEPDSLMKDICSMIKEIRDRGIEPRYILCNEDLPELKKFETLFDIECLKFDGQYPFDLVVLPVPQRLGVMAFKEEDEEYKSICIFGNMRFGKISQW